MTARGLSVCAVAMILAACGPAARGANGASRGPRVPDVPDGLPGVVDAALSYQASRFGTEPGEVQLDSTTVPLPTVPQPEWLRRELRTVSARFVLRSSAEIDACVRRSGTCSTVRITGLRTFEGAVHVTASWSSSTPAGCGHSYSGTVILRPSAGVWEVVGSADEEHGSCAMRRPAQEAVERP